MWKTLKKQEIIDAIDGKNNPSKLPISFTPWFNPFVFGPWGFVRSIYARLKYPDDIAMCGWHDFRWHINHMNPDNGSTLRIAITQTLGLKIPPLKTRIKLKKEGKTTAAFDNDIIIKDMEQVDDYIKKIPSPKKALLLFPGPGIRYKLSWCFSTLFECHWAFRGMENALMDFYLYPEETKRLYAAMTEYHKGIILRCKKELHCNGVFFTDDLGTQTGPFMSPEIFREFFFPYYKELCDYTHSLGMHFFLHSCGNIEILMPQLIEAGVDVIHPIQKFAMDQEEVFNKYHDQVAFFYGLDLQQIIPNGTSDEVEAEIKQKVDTFSKAKGRLLFTFGNALTPDCPIDNFVRVLKVARTYNPYKK